MAMHQLGTSKITDDVEAVTSNALNKQLYYLSIRQRNRSARFAGLCALK
jgi:hypothetical protein